LSSPPLRAERVTVFCFRLFRSLFPRSQKSQWVREQIQTVFRYVVTAAPAIGQAVGYWTVRRGRRFGYVASIAFPITNHFSPIRRASLAQARASHLSLFTCPQSPNLSHLTNHGRACGQAVRFQDLFLAFSSGTSRLAFGISYSRLRQAYGAASCPRPRGAVIGSKDWLNSGDNDYGDLDNDGNSLTASSIVEGPFLPMRKKPDARGPYLVIKSNITTVETTNGRFRGFRRICLTKQ
jgi:hypothetical protein